jgi:tetratricopeptide (TPR) repeat protein
MKKIGLLALFLVFQAEANLSQVLSVLEKNKDDLAIRIVLREQFRKEISFAQWRYARALLGRRPSVGFDLVMAWDRHPAVKKMDQRTTKTIQALEKADQLMLSKDFEEAFKTYQSVAKFFRAESKSGIKRSNVQFYYSVLHSMGRALYGANRLADAIEVYSWIPASYYQTQQVLFEKMWAGFRAKRYDIALGAVASQRSAFYSEFLEPETYLVQIYVLKRLCRAEQAQKALESIKKFYKALQSGSLTYQEWARRDLYWSSLQLLTERRNKLLERLDIVNEEQRLNEISKIDDRLKKQFSTNKPNLVESLRLVIGYSTLAVRNDNTIGKVNKLEDPETLRGKGIEWWPAEDTEEWLDEIGSHIFVGESLCEAEGAQKK